ncbi:antibiotic biosynthesis monooxygenase [Streptomyces sp. NBC_01381]|uniref:antibiotic biosynthesis monooxygenase n=1 Tax=Streptomyces sp. NBC_01381 TaxID=2903845 RepID=UPI0022587507|nr:antibiotic biosynthesis monooxygenase [Streptomyces sp. NBC_01381]MCX4673091.1 antibiotic biosynthesis monooxygenase [Streptomyces sp. NBC_01381]
MPAPIATTFPDVRRTDAGTILVSSWIVPSPDVQSRAADLVIGEWERQERPDAMLSLTAFLSEDGGEVLNYAQWTDDDAHREWVRTRRPAAIGRVDEAVPGIERPGVVRYALHRSYVPQESAGRRPGVLVTPTFETEGPQSQRALSDAVIEMLERIRPAGLLGAHFHASKDGRRVLNYAEWEDMPAWERFAEDEGSIELRTVVGALDGVTPGGARLGVQRYFPYKSLENIPAP